jgi:hypothetical protein
METVAPAPPGRTPVGDLRLVLSSETPRAGGLVSAEVEGANLQDYLCGVYDTFEANTNAEWRTSYYLTIAQKANENPRSVRSREGVSGLNAAVPDQICRLPC